jgi:hypothetical protein
VEAEHVSTKLQEQGDVQSCTNYRGIKLMNHTIKLYERIIEHRLWEVTNVKKKTIWFYTRKIDYEGDFLDKATYEKI